MVTTLASFASQFDPSLIEKGKALFDENQISPLVQNDLNWQATVSDKKNYKLSVRVDKGKVTDVFCPCGPGVCRHIIGVLFALQQQLTIETAPFDPAQLEPPPHVLLGRRLNDLIYTSRAAGTKDGELEKLGADLILKDPDVDQLRAIVMQGAYLPNPKSHYPILHGAKRLLGAAILKYEQEEYDLVFAIARAILTEVCSGGNAMNGFSADSRVGLNTLALSYDAFSGCPKYNTYPSASWTSNPRKLSSLVMSG